MSCLMGCLTSTHLRSATFSFYLCGGSAERTSVEAHGGSSGMKKKARVLSPQMHVLGAGKGQGCCAA